MALIIVLDDEPRLLKTVTRFLENDGHEVTSATSFEDVEACLRPGRFDVLLSDIFMPGWSGMDVLREVTSRGCDEPVVLITGDPNIETASEAVRSGAFDYVSKPLTKDKLLEVVGRAVRHIELVRERDQAKKNEMELLRSFATIGESAAILAHEIKTPLTNLNLALQAVGDSLQMEHSEVIGELVDRLERMQGLMKRTLSFAKPIQPQLAPCDPKALMESVCNQVRGVPGNEGITAKVRVADEHPGVMADQALLEEVLANLVQNAVEACERKGKVILTCEHNGSGLTEIRVEDDGPGIPPERRDELFKLFHTTKSQGTGMGLAISRKIIEAHEGALDLAEGELGGACFKIQLRTNDVGGMHE